MKYDEKYEWYESLEVINEKEISVTIRKFAREDEKKVSGILNVFVKWLNENMDKIVEEAIDEELLNLKNSYWNDEEKVYDSVTIKNYLELNNIDINNNDGKVELWFNDNGIFDNHMILIRLKKNDDGVYKYKNATLEG